VWSSTIAPHDKVKIEEHEKVKIEEHEIPNRVARRRSKGVSARA